MTMHPLKHFEDSFDNAQWRKTKQMQCDHACFDPSALRVHLKSHNGEKPKKVQPMWLGIFSGSQFEKTLDNTQHGEKQNKCNQCDYASSQASNLRTHVKTHSGEKSNKCDQCDFACIWKQTVEKIQTNVRRGNVLQPSQAIYGDIHILEQIILNWFGKVTQNSWENYTIFRANVAKRLLDWLRIKNDNSTAYLVLWFLSFML